jgi:hypothetical protein
MALAVLLVAALAILIELVLGADIDVSRKKAANDDFASVRLRDVFFPPLIFCHRPVSVSMRSKKSSGKIRRPTYSPKLCHFFCKNYFLFFGKKAMRPSRFLALVKLTFIAENVSLL